MTEEKEKGMQTSGFDREYLPLFEKKIFFEGPGGNQQIINFTILLGLSTIIATFGILSDSTAAVIGAMIIAPLMTPILGFTAALKMGNSGRSFKSLVLICLGIATVIFLSALLGRFVPDVLISFTSNAQITARVSPSLFDLGIALAAGAAGAYATGRQEISEWVSGVAIAISLVPPLSVVGICLAHGYIIEAGGSFLLFLTNLFAIILSGFFVFTMMGLGPLPVSDMEEKTRKKAIQAIVIGTVIIFAILAFTGYSAFEATRESLSIRNAAKEWVTGTPFQVTGVQANETIIDVSIRGEGTPPSIDLLAGSIVKKISRRPLTIRIHIMPQKEVVYNVIG
jgi:uncharacterized hydrophobic protein (TIGR00271 family)